jgi:hypothetical protein
MSAMAQDATRLPVAQQAPELQWDGPRLQKPTPIELDTDGAILLRRPAVSEGLKKAAGGSRDIIGELGFGKSRLKADIHVRQ